MKILITALAALLLITSCADKLNKFDKENNKIAGIKSLPDEKTESDNLHVSNVDLTADTVAKQLLPAEQKNKQQQPAQSKPVSNPDWDKKIIKTASLNLEVKDYKSYYSSFREKVKSLGGYVAQEEQNQSDYKIENTLTIKVPVDQFDDAVSLLTNGVEKVNEKKITSQDVTAEFVDTKSRMEAKKQVRERYMDLLKQAKNMEEILSVQNEINGVQEQIESAAGRIEYLGHSAVFSTINLTYYQILNSTAKDSDAPPSFGTKLSNAFKTGWSWVGELFVGLVSIWPLFLLGFLLIIFFKRMKAAKPKQA